jgi:hypothetical protein
MISVPFEIHAYPIFDQEGNVCQIIEYTLDITNRKKTEKALKQREKELGNHSVFA